MSDNLPPGEPGPYGPPPGKPGPYGPPPGQPAQPAQPGQFGQSGRPPVEHLDTGGGQPLPPGQEPRGRKRPLLIGGGILMTAVLVGGGVWGWNAWFNQGPQPSEALPTSTLAYLSVDLDPTGEQKVEALRTLRKFPAFKEEVGLDTDDDIRKRLFEEMQDTGTCEGLDYGDDVEPWLGERVAFAFVKHDTDEVAAPVFVLQVKDQDKAEDGLDKLVDCTSEGSSSEPGDQEPAPDELGGYAFNGDWVVLAESEKIANDVASQAKDEPLSGDEDYQKWTEAAGDPGIVTMYAAPAAGAELLTILEDVPFGFGGSTGSDTSGSYEPSAYAPGAAECGEPGEMPEELRASLEEFPGGAGSVRFDDGNLEIEFAVGEVPGSMASLTGNGKGADVLSTLPDTTAAALGLGFAEGWVQDLLDEIQPVVECQGGMSMDEAIDMVESETGLSVPEDIEALGGESFAIAFDGDVDPSAFEEEDITRVPLGAKIKGDPEKIEAALDKLRARLGADAEMLLSRTEGDHVVVSASPDYLDALAETGDLGDSSTFEDLVPHREGVAGVLYIDFNAGDDWLNTLLEATGAPDEVLENTEPLKGAGFSSWQEDGETHSLLKITTE